MSLLVMLGVGGKERVRGKADCVVEFLPDLALDLREVKPRNGMHLGNGRLAVLFMLPWGGRFTLVPIRPK